MDWQKIVTDLLNKAQDRAATEEERKTYTERATYLMAKYGVETLLDRPADIPLDVQIVVLPVPNPYSKLRGILIASVAQALGLRTVRTARTKEIHVFGLAHDLENMSNLYASLWIQALMSLNSAEKPEWEHGKTFNHSYLLGFIHEVYARIQAAADRANRDSAESAPSTALVLKNRASAIDEKVAEVFTSLRKGTSSSARSTTGYVSGVSAGSRADINQPRMGGSYPAKSALTY